MKKSFLLLISAVLGIALARAEMVPMKFTIDNASRITLRYSNGYGDEIPCVSGEQTIMCDNTQQPILVSAVDPAWLVSVLVNDNPVSIMGGTSMGSDGHGTEARVGIAADNTIVITTGSDQVASDFTIDLDHPEFVTVTDANGRGKVLDLKSGENGFALDELVSPLKVAANEGCEILGVTLNDEKVSPNGVGAYIIEVTKDSRLAISSREIPGEVPVTLSIAGDYEHVALMIEGEPVAITAASMTVPVRSGDYMVFIPERGYNIAGFTASGGAYTDIINDDRYRVLVAEPMSVALTVEKLTAGDNEALIFFETDETRDLISFSEYNADGFVRSLDPQKAYVLPIGNTVNINTYITNVFFDEVTYDGTPVELTDSKHCSVAITKSGTIAVKARNKYIIGTSNTTKTFDGDLVGVVGNIQIKLPDGSLVSSVEIDPGESVEIVAEPSPGWNYVNTTASYYDLGSATGSADFPEKYTTTFTLTEEMAAKTTGSVFLKGTFEEGDIPTYLLWADQTGDEGGNVMGSVSIVYKGRTWMGIVLPEGEQVELAVTVWPGYEFDYVYTLANNRRIGSPYTVSGEDAYSYGIIFIKGAFLPEGGGVDSITDGEIADRVYTNAAGLRSATPFEGFNIVTTTYTDGRIATTREMHRR